MTPAVAPPPNPETPDTHLDAVCLPQDDIDLGNGERMSFWRHRKFNQSQIRFTHRPDVQYRDILYEQGWKGRPNEEGKPWTKQLAKSDESCRFARAESERVTHQEFLDLANKIRTDKGMEPVMVGRAY